MRLGLGLGLGLTKDVGFSPLNISGLGAWYDAYDASTITEAAGAVSQWDDKSGNLRHITQSTGANQPIYTNGDNVSFDGTNDWLGNSTPFIHAAGATTIFMVGSNMLQGGGQPLTESNHTSATPFYNPVASNATDSQLRFLNRDDASSINIELLGGTFFDGSTKNLLTFSDDGAELNAYQNGTLTSLSPIAFTRDGATTLTRFTVGALRRTTISDYANFDLHELIIYERLLTNAERTSITTYLSNRWSV